jgi:hypothetical protein
MVVVEGARARQGERLTVVITGALQNPTGRIVFARLEQSGNGERPRNDNRSEGREGKGERAPGKSR